MNLVLDQWYAIEKQDPDIPLSHHRGLVALLSEEQDPTDPSRRRWDVLEYDGHYYRDHVWRVKECGKTENELLVELSEDGFTLWDLEAKIYPMPKEWGVQTCDPKFKPIPSLGVWKDTPRYWVYPDFFYEHLNQEKGIFKVSENSRNAKRLRRCREAIAARKTNTFRFTQPMVDTFNRVCREMISAPLTLAQLQAEPFGVMGKGSWRVSYSSALADGETVLCYHQTNRMTNDRNGTIRNDGEADECLVDWDRVPLAFGSWFGGVINEFTRRKVEEEMEEIEPIIPSYRPEPKKRAPHVPSPQPPNLKKVTDMRAEKAAIERVLESYAVDKQQMFHFVCPVCGSKAEAVPLTEYLASWSTKPPEQAYFFLGLVASAAEEVYSGLQVWPTKKFLRNTGRLIEVLSLCKGEAPTVPPIYITSGNWPSLNCGITCPVCNHPPGERGETRWFTTWDNACRVQVGNLFYEADLIVTWLLVSSPAWITLDVFEKLLAIHAALVEAGETVGFDRCSSCGRFANALSGGTGELAGRCRWCLDFKPTILS
jgi:hypothetical protein